MNLSVSAPWRNSIASVVITCSALPGQWPRGERKLADLSFDTVSNQHSAFFRIEARNAEGIKSDGAVASTSFSEGGLIGVVGAEALLEGRTSMTNFVIYGRAGKGYRVEATTNLTKA